MTTDETEIRDLIDEHRKALHDKDADALVARYSQDVLIYDLAPPLRSNGPEVERDALRAWFATWKGPIAYDVSDLSIEVADRVAFSTGLARMQGIKLDGSEPDLWFRTTACYRKRADGQWEVAHRHESVPFHMDGSFRAAIDLQP
jgi:ketosteroid isomerase-like protein